MDSADLVAVSLSNVSSVTSCGSCDGGGTVLLLPDEVPIVGSVV